MDHRAFQELIAAYNNRITVDLGTGDGLFVYRSAQANPDRFFIGIDANRRPLQKISEKIYRKPAKGGLPNVLFVQSAVEDLPQELDGIATEVLIQFPWGSLLRGVAGGDEKLMRNVRRICVPEAHLSITIALDLERDRQEWARLGLPPLSLDYIEALLATRSLDAGFKIVERKEDSISNVTSLQTSWARRLRGSSHRSVITITARAIHIDAES